MATFAKSTFNASVYSASRPTYPQQLFDYIFNYHRRKPRAGWARAIDLGCGTGQATTHLHPFHEIIGLDPSENMVKAAIANNNHEFARKKFQFRRGRSEDLADAGIESDSVDLIIAAQACHWFDWDKVWPETARVLKAGGTAAFWIYSEFRLSYPGLTPLITAYAQGSDPVKSLGPYFQRPGRTILENHLMDVPSPTRIAEVRGRLVDEERVYFAGDYHTATLPSSQTLPIIMRKEMRWRDLLGYFRTWSSLHAYHERYPEDKTRPHDGRFLEDLEEYTIAGRVEEEVKKEEEEDVDVRGGDIAVRFWKDLRSAAVEETGGRARVGVDDLVIVEWPLAVILVSRI